MASTSTRRRRTKGARARNLRALAVWFTAAALLAVLAVGIWWLPGRVDTPRPEGATTGENLVSWADTRTLLVEPVAGEEPPLVIDTRTEDEGRLPVDEILMHLSGSAHALGVESVGRIVSVDLETRRSDPAADSAAATARHGVPSPDESFAAAPVLAQGAPTDGWSLFDHEGQRVSVLAADGAGSAAAPPNWSADSQAVAIPFEPEDSGEATVLVAWAPEWRPVPIRLEDYSGGPVAFGPSGAKLAYARTDGASEVRWVGRATGEEASPATVVEGLAGLAGRDGHGRMVAFTARDGGATGALELLGEPGEPAPAGENVLTTIELPAAPLSAVLCPTGRFAAVTCGDVERRCLYVVDLESGEVREMGGKAEAGG